MNGRKTFPTAGQRHHRSTCDCDARYMATLGLSLAIVALLCSLYCVVIFATRTGHS